jgi:hypothetical protein
MSEPISVSCFCGARLSLPAESAGRKVKCPQCGIDITVPGKAPEPVVETPKKAPEPAPAPSPAPAAQPRSPADDATLRRAGTAFSASIIVWVLGMVIALVYVVSLLFVSRDVPARQKELLVAGMILSWVSLAASVAILAVYGKRSVWGQVLALAGAVLAVVWNLKAVVLAAVVMHMGSSAPEWAVYSMPVTGTAWVAYELFLGMAAVAVYGSFVMFASEAAPVFRKKA